MVKPEYSNLARTGAHVLPYMMDRFLTLGPEDKDILRDLQLVLRSALRVLYDPPAENPRLVARISRLGGDQLVELLAAAALRDSSTLRQSEAALRTVDSPPWDALPGLVVSLVAVHLNGKDGLTWCAACRSFRLVQPPVRVLAVNEDTSYVLSRPADELPPDARPYLTVVLKDKVGNGYAHRILESVSPRHAAEITHLFFSPWLDIHVAEEGVPLLANPAHVIGAQFTAMQALYVTHPGRGYTGGRFAPFANATCQLIRSVVPTLRTLSVNAITQLTPDDLLGVIPMLGNLRRLRLHVRAPGMGGFPTGRPGDTHRLKARVKQVCTGLERSASIKCHTRGTLQYRRMMAEMHGGEMDQSTTSDSE